MSVLFLPLKGPFTRGDCDSVFFCFISNFLLRYRWECSHYLGKTTCDDDNDCTCDVFVCFAPDSVLESNTWICIDGRRSEIQVLRLLDVKIHLIRHNYLRAGKNPLDTPACSLSLDLFTANLSR